MRRTLVELCAGTASVSLRALVGRPVTPLTGYMGSKRRWSPLLAEVLGYGTLRPDAVVLVDAGPWGDVWTHLCHREVRRDVVAEFVGWRDREPHALWAELVGKPPPTDAPARIAQYLWLQARSAGTIPIWWSIDRARWESATGSRTETAQDRGGMAAAKRGAGERADGPAYEAGGSRALGATDAAGATAASARGKPTHRGCRGVQYPATLAARVRALDAVPWERVTVIAGDLRSVPPIPGADVYFDPPYLHCPRYAATCPRADVLAVALAWRDAGARVLVSEAEPLPLAGFHAEPLTAREWLTGSFPFRLAHQFPLFAEAS